MRSKMVKEKPFDGHPPFKEIRSTQKCPKGHALIIYHILLFCQAPNTRYSVFYNVSLPRFAVYVTQKWSVFLCILPLDKANCALMWGRKENGIDTFRHYSQKNSWFCYFSFLQKTTTFCCFSFAKHNILWFWSRFSPCKTICNFFSFYA